MHHFGYGSNLNTEFQLEYLPSAQSVQKAYPQNLTQFRFWNKKREGGISTMPKPGNMVHGVIYECINVIDGFHGRSE